ARGARAARSVALAGGATARVLRGGGKPLARTIVVGLRLPRVLLAILIGVALGTSGAAYQALFRNPLADPFVVGASSGAAAGASLVIVTGWAGWGGLGGLGGLAGVGPVSLGAFVRALLAVCLVYAIAAAGRMPPISLLLVGTIVTTMLGAVVWLLMALAHEHLDRIFAWLLGGLAGHGWDSVAAVWPTLLAGSVVLCLL